MSFTFISYVRENSSQVDRLATDLQRYGIKVWLDREDLRPGERLSVIRRRISEGAYFIACFSKEGTQRSRSYMREEVLLAIDELRRRPLDRVWFIPVLLSETEVPDYTTAPGETLRDLNHVELYKDWDRGIVRIRNLILAKDQDWRGLLKQTLIDRFGRARGFKLYRDYGEALAVDYREHIAPENIAHSLNAIAELDRSASKISVMFAHRGATFEMHAFTKGAPIDLSAAIDILGSMGFQTADQRRYEILVKNGISVWYQTFELQTNSSIPKELTQLDNLAMCYISVHEGDLENGRLNSLVLSAGLRPRFVHVLRAYASYLSQATFIFSQAYIEQIISSSPNFAVSVLRLFEVRFDPEKSGSGRATARRMGAIRAEARAAANKAYTLDVERIFTAFLAVVDATLRTNFYQRDAFGKPKVHLSLKLDSRQIEYLPRPRPLFEVFVYCARTEGFHLRMGRIARGGIRWSERREDFRIEALGLMKAQVVKNTVIVPTGAKGGFLLKRVTPTASREEVQRETIACYQIYIRGLLDLTDNQLRGKIVPPSRTRRRDGDDPYLVVAADKGTATFSDVANAVAAEYGFWLGDAFAVGGSEGYDHKMLAVTSRGAWVCVKRHLRDLGIDCEAQEFTVAGIGDMSGDVFGNGMLRSPHIRLLAAFDHRHIFLDPDPDPAASFKERQRLFSLPRCSWADYDKRVLSKGGAVFSRASEEIRLPVVAAAMLGLHGRRATPKEVIRAILKMDVDVLWNGGIGTYARGSQESNLEVGDRANDAVRVEAKELRCKVIGEGGNLGLSQRARVEYARAGGRINTDFTDNSGGVQCSDMEVNIKILLSDAIMTGELKPARRNEFLRRAASEIVASIEDRMARCFDAISLSSTRAPQLLDEHTFIIKALESEGLMDRGIEFLPGDDELAERRRQGSGLLRPEIAVVLAYVRLGLTRRLEGASVTEEDVAAALLLEYFPPSLRKRFPQLIRLHPLRSEISLRALVNEWLGLGLGEFIFVTAVRYKVPVDRLARAYFVTRESFRLERLASDLQSRENEFSAREYLGLLADLRDVTSGIMWWALRNLDWKLSTGELVSRLRADVQAIGARKSAPRKPRANRDGRRGATASESRTAIIQELQAMRAVSARLESAPVQ